MVNIKPGKVYKVFLVEEDDDYRERVISALSDNISIEYEPQYIDLLCDDRIFANHKQVGEDYTITIKLIPRADGTYITVENFYEDPEEEYDE